MHRYGQGEKEVSSLALDTTQIQRRQNEQKTERGVALGPVCGEASVKMEESASLSRDGEGINSNFACGSRGIGISDGSQLEGHGERCSGER